MTVEHVAGIPVRNKHMLAFARHCGVTVHTCEAADPASKGGSENTVKITKADLVPTEANQTEQYASFAEFEAACELFCAQVNDRPHRVTRRRPGEMLAEERQRLHRLPDAPHTVAFGVTRTVPVDTAMISFDHGQHSVPDTLLGQQVWVRRHGVGEAERVIIVHVGSGGPVEVARHPRATTARRRSTRPTSVTRRRSVRSIVNRSPATFRSGTSSPSATAPGSGLPRLAPRARRGCG